MRIAAIDFGTARIGLAISDERQILSTPLGYLKVGKSLEESAQLLIAYFTPYFPLEAIVIGLPLFLNGKQSPLSLEVKKLAALLEPHLPILLWDERLSTMQAERMLKEAELNRKQRAKFIDGCSAAAILQNCLDSKKSVFC